MILIRSGFERGIGDGLIAPLAKGSSLHIRVSVYRYCIRLMIHICWYFNYIICFHDRTNSSIKALNVFFDRDYLHKLLFIAPLL